MVQSTLNSADDFDKITCLPCNILQQKKGFDNIKTIVKYKNLKAHLTSETHQMTVINQNDKRTLADALDFLENKKFIEGNIEEQKQMDDSETFSQR